MDANSQQLDELLRQAAEARRAARPEDARLHLIAAAATARSTGHGRALVAALAGLAQLLRDAGDAAGAVPLLEEAVTHGQQLQDPHALAHALRHLGELHLELGHVERAQQHLREALDLYRVQPATAPLDLANAVRPLAICLECQGADDQARMLWGEAHDLYAGLGIDAGVTECSAGVARLTTRPV
ncbi:MAG: tetratricopeptide repeat protein [Acidobacteria bacterium]|nr:tetratricopeptide repeat protein [Acidobacteriota bacterium]